MIIDLLKKRSSVRKFKPDPVPKEIVERMIEAGRLSPSGGNEQPWLFGVIDDPKIVSSIAAAAYGQLWMTKAPLLIVLCTGIVPKDAGGRDIQNQRFPELSERTDGIDDILYAAINLEEHQTKIAGENMVLAALEEGLGTCWISRFDVMRVASLLKLPKMVFPSEILAIGYPSGENRQAPKRPASSMTFHNEYGKEGMK